MDKFEYTIYANNPYGRIVPIDVVVLVNTPEGFETDVNHRPGKGFKAHLALECKPIKNPSKSDQDEEG